MDACTHTHAQSVPIKQKAPGTSRHAPVHAIFLIAKAQANARPSYIKNSTQRGENAKKIARIGEEQHQRPIFCTRASTPIRYLTK